MKELVGKLRSLLSFLKKGLVFQKTCLKVKVMKMFKISSDFHVKACRSLKQRAI